MSFVELLDAFRGMAVVVVGDLMVDEYVFGKASRISPEAPVMVIRQERSLRLPGGAANVARNLAALGADVRVVGVRGEDEGGQILASLLNANGIARHALVADPSRQTTRKTRVVADHSHQVLRIDAESDGELDPSLSARLVQEAVFLLEGCAVLVLSDYLKGTLSSSAVASLIGAAKERGIPVVANPKPRSLGYYRGASLLSLNRAETAEALGRWDGIAASEALEAARAVKEKAGADAILVTLGEDGMAATGPRDLRVAAPKVEVYDTAGAGDTVVATVALGLASRGFEREVFELAAHTAACVVRHVGVATPSVEDLEQLRAIGPTG